MNIPSKNELRYLMMPQSGICISIVLSTHRMGMEMQSDPLKLRNAIRTVEKRLHESGLRSTEELLKPIQALLDEKEFWQHEGDSLVIFRSSHLFRVYRMPLRVTDQIIISDHFYVKPLLPLLVDDGRFYVLALSQNDTRLLEGTHYNIQEIALPEAVPRSLAEALKYDDIEDNDVRHYSSSSGADRGKRGRRAAIFYGQGVGIDDLKDQILRYFQQVNHGLHELLRNETAPLVLAGVEYLIPIYQEANTYPHLMEQAITGNPDKLKAETLHKQAWTIVQPFFLKPEREAADRYKATVGTEYASNAIEEVLLAATYGRVESLFVALDQMQWGSFDPATNTLARHQEAEPGDEDLLDVAAVQTLLHGGAVYAVEQAEMPAESLVAAVYRY
jgi:Bacterial archaeo-eukaryotic release factor family 7